MTRRHQTGGSSLKSGPWSIQTPRPLYWAARLMMVHPGGMVKLQWRCFPARCALKQWTLHCVQ